jgi:hypothetical protein
VNKAKYQQQNDDLRNKLAAYEELGSPQQISDKIETLELYKREFQAAAVEARATLSMIKKLLA